MVLYCSETTKKSTKIVAYGLILILINVFTLLGTVDHIVFAPEYKLTRCQGVDGVTVAGYRGTPPNWIPDVSCIGSLDDDCHYISTTHGNLSGTNDCYLRSKWDHAPTTRIIYELTVVFEPPIFPTFTDNRMLWGIMSWVITIFADAWVIWNMCTTCKIGKNGKVYADIELDDDVETEIVIDSASEDEDMKSHIA